MSGQSMRRWMGLVVALGALIAFWPATNAAFSDFDDHFLLIENTAWRGLRAEQLRWMFTTTYMGHYQPLTWASFALDHALWGMDPRGFHLTNLIVHALNALLVYCLGLRLIAAARAADKIRLAPGLDWQAAGAGALLWAVHPLRAESVAWVTERRDVLSACLLLLALLAYLRAFAVRAGRPTSLAWYAASIGLLLLSLLSKAWGMSFFVVLVVVDWWPLGRLGDPKSRRAAILQKVPYALLGVVFLVVAGYAQKSAPGTARTLEQWGIVERAVQAAYGLAFYLWKSLLPVNLAALYELPRDLSPGQPRYIAACAFVVAAGVTAVAVRHRFPAVTTAAAVYAVLLAPVLGLFQSGDQFVADRYSYLACIGWSLVAGYGAARLMAESGARRSLFGAAIAAGILVLGVLTWRQAGYWRDSRTLWAHAIDAGADGPIVRVYYGLQLEAAGDRAGAIAQYRSAIAADPTNGRAHFSLANALAEGDDPAEAEREYLSAVELMPDAWRPLCQLGTLYMQYDRPREAIEVFRHAVADIESRPPVASGLPYLLLGSALVEAGDAAGARQNLERAASFPAQKEAAARELVRVERN